MRNRKTILPSAAPKTAPTLPSSIPLPTRELLQGIRDNANRERLDTNKTIADLEALSDEIETTVAFLKAQRGRRHV